MNEPVPSPAISPPAGRAVAAGLGDRAVLTLVVLFPLACFACTPAQNEEPHDNHALATLGQWHLAHGRLSEAERVLRRALAPDDARLAAQARMHLGEIELRRGLLPGQGEHLAAARESLETSVRSGLAPARAHALLGEVHQRMGDLEAARSALERAVTLDPHDAEAFTRLGMVRRDLGALAEARAAFERAVALDPRSAEAWCGLGLLLGQMEQAAEAEAALRRALALEPDQPESNAALGRFQELRGERAAAEASYRRAVGVNPDYVDGLHGLGALLAEGEQRDEALRLLDRVVALRPPPRPHVRAYLASARLRIARGEDEVPRRLLAAVLAFNPAQGEARALLAELERGPR
ncbi:MAG TPA: tetratricopeptide repeat protein [Planctomycetota bacterium]